MVSIMCLYLCTCIWAAAQDKKDAIKAGASPLLDNDPRDRYLYELTIYTGSTLNSGTTAKVSMIFSGDEDESQPRLIYDDKRPVLKTGGVDTFVMAVPRSLGALNHVRVWHDNSGKHPSWFFSRMQVVDMQNLNKYYFILDRWLSAGEDDGLLDRIVPLAGKDELTGFSHVFYTKAQKDLWDGHLWFSIFTKPHKSSFTRVQRLTCCLSLLFTSMMANIFLYRGDDDKTASQVINIGPLSLTPQQIMSGIISSLIAFPINLLIALIFKYSKQTPFNLGHGCCKKSKKKNPAGDLTAQARILDDAYGDEEGNAKSFASLSRLDQISGPALDPKVAALRKKNKKFKLPWWFQIVGFFLAIAAIGVSFWYTVEVGGTFGPEKSAKWMASFCISIVESIFLSQPIKVVGLAFFYALVIKKPSEDDNADPGLEKGEEYLHKHEVQSQKLSSTIRKKLSKYKNVPLPPTEEYLHAARAMRQKEEKMWIVLKEIVLYVIFFQLLIIDSYGNRDPNASLLYSSLNTEFYKAAYSGKDAVRFDDVKEYKSFWTYCNNTLLPALFPDGSRSLIDAGDQFTADGNSIRVGVPRLRQLRMASKQCQMPVYRLDTECNQEYSLISEETKNYAPGWIPLNKTVDIKYPGWYWESSNDLDGFPFLGEQATYGGGGYNIELAQTRAESQKILNSYYNKEWLDTHTRAVVIEFVLYCPNMNVFAVSEMTFEFLATGSVIPTYKMTLIKLDRYVGNFMIVVMVAELLTCAYIIYFIVKEVKIIRLEGKAYFQSFWNILEFLSLILILITVSMFSVRFALSTKTRDTYKANTNHFTSFQYATTWEELYGWFLSILIFLVTIKFLKLLRFNKRMSMLGLTLSYIIKPLMSFLVTLFIIFFAYSHLAYLVYASSLKSFSTLTSALSTMFSLMLNKFDYKSLDEANPVFAPIIFFSFTIIIIFVLLGFMITIILDGFAAVQEELKQRQNQFEMVDFIVSKFKGMIGLSSGLSLPPMNREPSNMVDETHEQLMDKFQEFDHIFRDFFADESKGDEKLIAKYEKQIFASKLASKMKTIYSS